MTAFGHKRWAIADGHVPLRSTGHEPENTSHDRLCFLNTSDEEARIEIMFYYMDQDPVGPYAVEIDARRVRHVRINDLIDPEAVQLDRVYGCIIESNVPIVVQFTRVDTSRAENAMLGTMAFPL